MKEKGQSKLKAKLEDKKRDVLERCAQLPLAIVTIAASFKCLIHDFEWRDALEDLKTSVKGSNNIDIEAKEGHLGLEDFSDEGKWREDLVKASLMYNNISRIPPNASPMCPKLSTLLLQGNKSLKDVPDSLFEHLHGLNVLDLSNTSIESLPNSVSNLENLTTLRLGGCWKLKHVPSLAKAYKIKEVRPWDNRNYGIKEAASAWVAATPAQLEEIKVIQCKQLEEIEEEEKEEEGMDTTKITLPRLKKLSLVRLPELKSICSSSKVISCDSLQEILIERCPKLKRLPLSLPLLNGQLSPPPSLKQIKAKEEWWESLEWDCQDTKNVLQPFFRKIQ
uniref:Disease resistance protein At4g27190-like leucine-rich repeats domain-containing protein n=1 Tax=Fagus sylvatica TaxID=28930 RepID=A0A2N9EG87_FAGSY